MKKLLAIIVLGLLLNGCYGASVRNHSNIQDKTVTIFNPETNKYYKSIKFISYADAYNDANQKCVSDTVSKNKNPEFCFAFSGFNGYFVFEFVIVCPRPLLTLLPHKSTYVD